MPFMRVGPAQPPETTLQPGAPNLQTCTTLSSFAIDTGLLYRPATYQVCLTYIPFPHSHTFSSRRSRSYCCSSVSHFVLSGIPIACCIRLLGLYYLDTTHYSRVPCLFRA
ncbi:hypothetical protein K523DRAFT_49750 [Schizophyllum commune Tattone D]|nr:hypothetical protein K523DRAFT_49750 [Schizophyllum commune Tattone D]